MDDAAKIVATLVQAIRRLLQKNTQFPERHGVAQQQLADIFQHAKNKTPTQAPSAQQKSTNPMSTSDIRAAPRTHAKVTRAKTPGILPISQQLPTPTSEGDRMETSEGVKQKSSKMESTPAHDTDRVRKQQRSTRLIPNETPQGTETPTSPTQPIDIQTPRFITQEELNLFTYNFHANEHVRKRQARQLFEVKYNRNRSTTPYCAAAIHPITG